MVFITNSVFRKLAVLACQPERVWVSYQTHNNIGPYTRNSLKDRLASRGSSPKVYIFIVNIPHLIIGGTKMMPELTYEREVVYMYMHYQWSGG